MKAVSIVVLVVLILLAGSSGVAKVMLVPQDAAFFGKYGFSNAMLIAFGVAQLVGAALMIFGKTRFIGATIVAVTFLVSLVMLLLEGNLPVSAITAVATLLLLAVMKKSWRPAAPAT